MAQMILNDAAVELPADDVNLLDWLRGRGLVAAKPACRRGDCGACQVLVGEVEPGSSTPRYRALNSCLLSTERVAGWHVITVEGLSAEALTPVQHVLVGAGAIQCGYCTPGLVIALTGALLNGEPPLAAAAGNLCRCTGYAGIRRAAEALAEGFPGGVGTSILPDAVANAASALRPRPRTSGGNTDAALRQPDPDAPEPPPPSEQPKLLRVLQVRGDDLVVGAGVTVAELQADPLVREAWPTLASHLELFGSPAIRAAATVGGNLVNASPVADLAVVLLALGARLVLDGPAGRRELPVAEFHRAYRRTALGPSELVTQVLLPRNPTGEAQLHAEKVSRRRHDDIASVCSALVVADGAVRFAAGGVAPIPLLLRATARALSPWPPDGDGVRDALATIPDAVAPIDDLRGSASYKTRLLQHQLLAHVAALVPGFAPLVYLP